MPTATGAPPTDPLTDDVRSCANTVRAAVSDRDRMIVRAHAKGAALAALARAADLDVGTVRRIIQRAS